MKIMTFKMSLFLIILPLLLMSTYSSQFVFTNLTENWKLKIIDGTGQSKSLQSKVISTSIPTVLHLDLLKEAAISDPFLDRNYLSLKWVAESTIIYSTLFSISQELLKMNHHQLVFEGIDTYSEIKVNGHVVAKTENAFRKYVVDVKSVLKKGENSLEVKIEPTTVHDNDGQRTNSMPFVYAHTRKACYQYSWDWAPELKTLGIWKPVYLESFNEAKIDYVWVRTRFISKKKATVNFAIALNTTSTRLESPFMIKIFHNKTELASFPIIEKYSYYDLDISNPQLWWPNGIGKPNVYDFVVQLLDGVKREAIDEKKVVFGIRTAELDQTDKKFTVKINGYPVYCKGANYVPPDMLYPRLTNPRYTPGNTIENLMNDAVESNFNMIRLWGGGQYQSDLFFELASRKGIMIFHDFMFSDSIYPSSELFLLNVQEEIKQQVRRVRNYPALVLWSGNNQILQGINDWGWRRQNYEKDYHNLFEILIPKVIEYESPYIPYIPSSPVFGVGNYGFQRGGDVHYWGVWAGGSDFQEYRRAVGYFNSEFGTQGLPVWETVKQMVTSPAERKYQSQTLLTHERHSSRFGMLKTYMAKYMRESQNFELETYQSGLLQAYAIEVAIKAQRISKETKSMGTLYWQFNDAWPAISWAAIDYYGRWKPLQYMAKRLYPDVAIYTDHQKKVYALNDKLYEVGALAIAQAIDFNGTILWEKSEEIKLAANSVRMLWAIQDSDFKGSDPRRIVIYTEIIAGKSAVMSSTHFANNLKFKDLDLPSAQLKVEFNPQFNEVTLSSTNFIKNLHIYHGQKYVKFSDNYFDVVPGHKVKVTVQGESLEKIKSGIKFRGYKQVYTKEELKIIQ